MNGYSWFIAGALLAEYLLGLLSGLLNTTALKNPLPVEFEGAVDTVAYRKSQAYSMDRERLGIISSSVITGVTFCFWFLRGFNAVDIVVRSWNLGPLLTGILYIGILLILRAVLSLPSGIYSTFVIEEKYGFNRTTPRTFILDLLKGSLVGILLGTPLLAAILALFLSAGAMAWFWCWITASVFIVGVQFIAPAWILPLFNKFTPLGDGDLRSAILSYTRSVNFSLAGISVMDGSKRSAKSNAFFTGFGKHKRIALYDTLIARHTVPELVCILAHEIGHYKKRHVVTGMLIAVAHTGLILYFLSLFIHNRGLTDAFFLGEHSVYAALALFGLLAIPVDFILSIGLMALSRKQEYGADRYAAETTGNPDVMAAALKKLSVDNYSSLTPHPFTVFLTYSHPTVLARIRALSRLRNSVTTR